MPRRISTRINAAYPIRPTRTNWRRGTTNSTTRENALHLTAKPRIALLASQQNRARLPRIFNSVFPGIQAQARFHIIEDTDETPESAQHRFDDAKIDRALSEPAIAIALAVTRRPGVTYADFTEGIALHPDPRVRTVKRADLRHNRGRLDELPEDEAAPLRVRYDRALARLDETDREAEKRVPA